MFGAKIANLASGLRTLIVRFWAELLLFLVSSAAYLYKLGSYRLYDGDELIYHQVAYNINKTGDWLTMHWVFNPDGGLASWFEKPPLILWLKALLIRLPGSVEFWSRLPSAAAGIGTVILTYLIAKKLFDKTTGVIAALIVVTAPGMVNVFRIGRLDGPLIFFFWLAIYFALRLKDHPKFYYFFGAAIGLAAMTKGATALLIPAIMALVWWWNGELTHHLRQKALWVAAAAAVIVTLPWHVHQLLLHGSNFWNSYFGFHVWQRINKSVVYDGSLQTGASLRYIKNASYYLQRLYGLFYPWIFLLPFGYAASLIATIRKEKPARLLLTLVTVIFLFFSLLKTRIVHYTSPAYPALAMMVALTILDAWRKQRLISVTGLWFAAILTLVTMPFVVNSGSLQLCLSILATLLIAWGWVRFSGERARVTLVASLAILGIASFAPFTEGIRMYKPVPARAAQDMAEVALEARKYPNQPLVVYPLDQEIISSFVALAYADRPIIETGTLGDIALATADKQTKQAIVTGEGLGQLYARHDVQIHKRSGDHYFISFRRVR